MSAVTKEDAALEELFMQLKKEFVSKKKVDPKTVRARFLAHVKQGQKSKFTYKRVGVFVLVPVLSILVVAAAVVAAAYKNELIEFVQGQKCVVENNLIVSELTRPVFNCELCRNMDRIERIANISRQEFLEKYAYTTVPVVITGATDSWKALDTFNYKYFKKLYTSMTGGMKEMSEACQFFNWGYPFETLEEVFNMTDARAKLEPGEDSWYIGWSNCHTETARELRKNYERPYFLPEESESSRLDWIFMGWPGPGAFLHIDGVSRPSWQAQISGRKKWTYVPVPECAGICKDKYEAIVEKGDIIIFDSNQWYHATFVMPGEISITIGSEYD
ncbi:hypothetical protein NP493_35g03036 [Ridgeia piscesae]|uniref:Cupin-like domain-containing protein n=1 Tax=Ridgeia piscesae TaxID=27915 RepID=A0AAD9PCL5_RIDPI|nr:hypothetical protein NP493_35g03036 [Ridgeia piscesae]